MREYKFEPHLKHLVLFMCKHNAQNLINVTANNCVFVETLCKPYVCVFLFPKHSDPVLLITPSRFHYEQELWMCIAVSLPLFWLFSFSVVFFLENYYFGKGWGLSHAHAFTHVFCNLKPESEANSNTAVTGSHLVLEMLSAHICTHLQSYFSCSSGKT